MKSRKPKQWIGIYIVYTIILFVCFIISRTLIESTVNTQNVFGLVILALASAILPCIAGYLGKPVFFILYSLSVIIGILYMYYAIIADIAPGWIDLTSLVSYIYILAIGSVIAFIAEVVIYFINKSRS